MPRYTLTHSDDIRRKRCSWIWLLGWCVLVLSAWPCWATASLRVVTTVAPLTDLVTRVGGEAIELHGLVPAGTNSNTFQPTPGDVKFLAQADLIILNGLHLEVPTEKLARHNAKPGAVFVYLGDRTISKAEWVFDFSFPKAGGHPNPHLWLNVAYAMHYVELIRDQLSAQDSANAALYQDNAARLLDTLERLDRCISTALRTIPPPHRKLLTYHDSWPYFAKRYGMTIVGAIQPANFAEPSAREVARMIDQLRREKVPAIFGSEVFSSKVLEKIAQEAHVHYVSNLRDDVLPGDPGDPQHSYVGMMMTNVTTMVDALGGEAVTLQQCFQHPPAR